MTATTTTRPGYDYAGEQSYGIATFRNAAGAVRWIYESMRAMTFRSIEIKRNPPTQAVTTGAQGTEDER